MFHRTLPQDLRGKKEGEDTTLSKSMGRCFGTEYKTPVQAMQSTEPCRKIVGPGTKCRHLASVAPDRKYDRVRPFDNPEDEANREHFAFL